LILPSCRNDRPQIFVPVTRRRLSCKIYLDLAPASLVTYRYLEHTADIGVQVEAESLRQAFSEAGIALFGIMTDTAPFKPVEKVSVSARGDDMQSLLYSYLEELIFIFDTHGLVIVRIDVQEITADPFTIVAEGWGERFDPEKHESRAGVKAITYHRMAVETEGGKNLLRYFVDI
jgi:SHS2 domain-containing protein